MGGSVGIVGGGAAGMMAAITAARQGADVTLIEGNDRLGRKLLSTGSGKCNLGNEKLGMEEYYTGRPELLEDCLRRFGTADTISFFQGIGLRLKSRNGYLYPACEQAAAVLDVLRYEIRELGVIAVTDCKITQIETERNRKGIRLKGSGRKFTFDRVILACGGQAAPKTGSDGSGYLLAGQLGHSLIPVIPALVQLKCREEYFKAVAGVRADAELSVYWQGNCLARERGELQLTDYGISGIAVFQLSHIVNRLLSKERCMEAEHSLKAGKSMEVEVRINLLPDCSSEDFERLCAQRASLKGMRTVEEFFTGMIHKKLVLLFIKLAGLRPTEEICKAEEKKIRQVYRLCRQWSVHVTGSNSFDNAQVCAGGVPLDEVTDSLESKKAPGVYFAGEILDVDGRCGGYNLQWAWCSGYLTGRAAAENSN